jgi:hypothetical protein
MKGGMNRTTKLPRSFRTQFRTRTRHLGGFGLALVLGLVELALAQDPIITLQPTSQTVFVGGNVMMSVEATTTNGPVTYQWQRDDPAVPVTFTNIPNATRVRLDLRNVTLEAAGDYRAIVGNAGGDTVTSDVAHLEVIMPPFTKITEGAIVEDASYSARPAWGDYNGDGWVDLFVANGLNTGAATVQFVYRNNGDGTFTTATWTSSFRPGRAATMPSIATRATEASPMTRPPGWDPAAQRSTRCGATSTTMGTWTSS